MVWTKNIKNILIFAALIRFVLLPLVIHGDITTVYWWGKFATDFSWRGYYDWLEFGGYNHPDQPMLYIYFAYLVRVVYLFFYQIFWFLNTHISAFPSNFMSWYFLYGNQILLKIPFVITDLILVYLVYKYTKNIKAALILAIYPPLIYNSAIWGSGDSLVNLLALIAIYFLSKRHTLLFTITFLTSILFKPSLLILSPVILIVFLKIKPALKQLILSALISLVFVYLISLPFAISNPLIWFFQIMIQKILPGVMHQLTSNAMNFWALFYGLKPQLDEILVFNLLSARLFSLIISSLFYIYICIQLYKNYSTKQLILSIVQITLVTFTFMTRMHERYTFPSLIPIFILSISDRKFLKFFILLSLTHMINIYHWWWFPHINFLVNLFEQEIIVRLVSLTKVILTLVLVFTKPFHVRKY